MAAQLGIGIKHSRPYIPQGRGKIERWFKFVRDNYLQTVSLLKSDVSTLDLLNSDFFNWVEAYNNKVHSTTKQSPYDRYQAGLECVRPAPKHLLDYFRQIEFRRVKKDRTIRLAGIILEAPVGLIDKQIELRFHPDDLSSIEIFFQNKSYGLASIVNPHTNSLIGRNWEPREKTVKKTDPEIPENPPITSGQLFNTTEENI